MGVKEKKEEKKGLGVPSSNYDSDSTLIFLVARRWEEEEEEEGGK